MDNQHTESGGTHREINPKTQPVRVYIVSTIFLAAAVAGTMFVVQHFKKPGQMTMLESQAMDMTVMKAPAGSVPVALETVGGSHFGGQVSYSGSVAPYSEQEVYPRVEGWVAEMFVYPGDKVTKGQLLARLESPDVDKRSAAAAADAGAAQASAYAADAEVGMAKEDTAAAADAAGKMDRMVDAAQASVDAAQAELDYRNSELDRMEKLYASGAISRSELEQERSMNASSRAELAKMNSELSAAQLNYNAMQAEARGATRSLEARKRQRSAMQAMARAGSARAAAEAINKDYLEIRSLLDGVVTERLTSPGSLARPGTPILKISDITRVRIQANVSESDAAEIAPGNTVIITTPRRPGENFYTIVSSVFPASDPTTRTVVVEALVNNPDRRYLPGDYVNMKISRGHVTNAITVPERAIVRWGNSGKPYVWVAQPSGPKGKIEYTCTMHPEVISDKPGKCPKCKMDLVPKQSSGALRARKVEITTGAASGERTQVLSGLHEGDRVVTDGGADLNEGDALFETKWSSDGPEKLPPPPGMENMGNMPGMKMDNSGKGKSMDNMKGMDMGGKSGSTNMDDMPGMDMGHDHAMDNSGGDMKGMDMGDKKTPVKSSPKTMDNMKGMDMGQSVEKNKPGAADDATMYTCPMHPEVKSDKPGSCPKCGMDLVPEKK